MSKTQSVDTPIFEITEAREESIRYLEHGFPCPLVRWHCHDDYELHFIAKSSGKMFVGDYVGQFEAGNLVLTGPRLPHNWVSTTQSGDAPIELRDMAVQFKDNLFSQLMPLMPELQSLLPMLDRACYGIEFRGDICLQAKEYMQSIRDTAGAMRLARFLEFMHCLSEETDYQLLSTVQLRSSVNDSSLDKVNRVVLHVTENYKDNICLAEVADLVGMGESAFSRFFHKATGNRFSDFLTRVRISRSCVLLASTDLYITNICYEVGFNNVANFNRRFRQVKGVTPREYRESARQRFNQPGAGSGAINS